MGSNMFQPTRTVPNKNHQENPCCRTSSRLMIQRTTIRLRWKPTDKHLYLPRCTVANRSNRSPHVFVRKGFSSTAPQNGHSVGSFLCVTKWASFHSPEMFLFICWRKTLWLPTASTDRGRPLRLLPTRSDRTGRDRGAPGWLSSVSLDGGCKATRDRRTRLRCQQSRRWPQVVGGDSQRLEAVRLHEAKRKRAKGRNTNRSCCAGAKPKSGRSS